jgi:hypothetical protein
VEHLNSVMILIVWNGVLNGKGEFLNGYKFLNTPENKIKVYFNRNLEVGVGAALPGEN